MPTEGRSSAVSYERSAALRIDVARARAENGTAQDEAANRRDKAARERDELAARRDRGALDRDSDDERAAQHAAADREEARSDRARAALDRELAALDRGRAIRERQAAGIDELTGARRRGVGLEELDREIDRARRTGTSLVAVFVDVDNLKFINDELSHRAGDELLCAVVDGLKRQLRSYDLVIRLGGDEFLCVLPGVSVGRARARFAELNAELQHGSISVGFSELHDHETRPELIDRADQEMLTTRASRRTATAARAL